MEAGFPWLHTVLREAKTDSQLLQTGPRELQQGFIYFLARISVPVTSTQAPAPVYSGGPLSDDGCIFRELNARIGLATGGFEKFSRIWGRAILANEGSDLETLSDEP